MWPIAVKPRTLGLAIALAVLMADQAAKFAVLSSPRPPTDSTSFTPVLDLTLRWNRGISFSLFAQNSGLGRTILLVVTLAAVALLALWLLRSRSYMIAAGLGAIIGGALGNAMDRIVHGAVVDFLDLHAFGWHFFVFNLGDAAINVGVALLLIDLLFVSRGQHAGEAARSPGAG